MSAELYGDYGVATLDPVADVAYSPPSSDVPFIAPELIGDSEVGSLISLKRLPSSIKIPRRALPRELDPTIRDILILLGQGCHLRSAFEKLKKDEKTDKCYGYVEDQIMAARDNYQAYDVDDLIFRVLKAGEIDLLEMVARYPWPKRCPMPADMRQALDFKILNPELNHSELSQLSGKNSLKLTKKALRRLNVPKAISGAVIELAALIASVDLTNDPSEGEREKVIRNLEEFRSLRGSQHFSWDEYLLSRMPDLSFDIEVQRDINQKKEKDRLKLTPHMQEIFVGRAQGLTESELSASLIGHPSVGVIQQIDRLVCRKYQVRDFESALFIAIDEGFVSLETILEGYQMDTREPLSRCQARVLKYLVTHPSTAINRSIPELNISPITVSHHMTQIISRLHAKNGVHAMMIGLAAMLGRIDLEDTWPVNKEKLRQVLTLDNRMPKPKPEQRVHLVPQDPEDRLDCLERMLDDEVGVLLFELDEHSLSSLKYPMLASAASRELLLEAIKNNREHNWDAFIKDINKIEGSGFVSIGSQKAKNQYGIVVIDSTTQEMRAAKLHPLVRLVVLTELNKLRNVEGKLMPFPDQVLRRLAG